MNSPETSRTCLNCGTQVDGRYCPRCGQEYGSTRITWRSLYDEAVSIFIGDSIFSEKDAVVRYGILRTLWSILIRPTTTVREYLAGKQVQIRPAAHAADARLHDLPAAAELVSGQTARFILSAEDDDPILQNISEFLNYYFNNHLELLAMLKIPYMALACKWIFRKCSSLRYMEYFYIGLYLASLHIILLSAGTILTQVCELPPGQPGREHPVPYRQGHAFRLQHRHPAQPVPHKLGRGVRQVYPLHGDYHRMHRIDAGSDRSRDGDLRRIILTSGAIKRKHRGTAGAAVRHQPRQKARTRPSRCPTSRHRRRSGRKQAVTGLRGWQDARRRYAVRNRWSPAPATPPQAAASAPRAALRAIRGRTPA